MRNESVVKLLLATDKVDPDTKDKLGLTPLSILMVHIGCGPFVIPRNPESAQDSYQNQIMVLGLQNRRQLMIARQKQRSFRRASQNRLTKTAYKEAKAMLNLLLATGKVDTDGTDRDSRTPINCAVQLEEWEAIVTLPLATGKVNPDTVDNDGQTPLSRAVEVEADRLVELLSVTGQQVGKQEDDGLQYHHKQLVLLEKEVERDSR